jgi:very-short-patch-repair endonuclease
MAAVLASGPDAVLSHRSAAQLWGLLRSSAAPEVTRPGSARGIDGIRTYQRALLADEVEEVAGIPATSVSRTLFDLAALLPRRQLERVMNEAEVLGLRSRLPLPRLLERYPGRPGTPLLRAVLLDDRALRGVTRSELEKRFVALIDDHRLPPPRRNASIAVRGRSFEVDCIWKPERLIVELDGRAAHGTRWAFEADRERDRLLVGDGWRVVRLTWRQLCDDTAGIAAELSALLA